MVHKGSMVGISWFGLLDTSSPWLALGVCGFCRIVLGIVYEIKCSSVLNGVHKPLLIVAVLLGLTIIVTPH